MTRPRLPDPIPGSMLKVMKKLLIVTAALAVVAHFAWRGWLKSNRANATAWAQGTDRVS